LAKEKANPSNDIPWCFYPSSEKICQDISFEGAPSAGFQGWWDGMYKNYMDNINIDNKGGVVASPDPNTPGGSYEYHWMRDAALTMRAFMEIHDFKYADI